MKTLIERLQDSVRLYAGATETPQAIAVQDWKEVEQLVAEHAALVAVEEACKALLPLVESKAMRSYKWTCVRDRALAVLTTLAAVRAGKGAAS